MDIKKAAVIGSGVMGSGIAAHIANAGVPVMLLDIVPKGANDRSALARRDREDAQDRSGAVHAPRRGQARDARQSRGRSGRARRLRLDRRGGDREDRDQARRVQEARGQPQEGLDRLLEHVDDPAREARGRPARQLPAGFRHHPFLQSAALHAPARDRRRAEDAEGRRREHRAVLRRAPRQGRHPRQGHARLRRQPHRHDVDPGRGERRRRSRPHGRRGRRGREPPDGLPQDRHLRPARSRRHRPDAACRQEHAREPAAL